MSGWFNPRGIERIAVDLDEVLAHWNPTYDRHLDLHGEAAALIPRTAERKEFNLKAGLTKEQGKIVDTIMATPGFYAELEPIEGGRQALEEMLRHGFDVRIVTSPWISNPTCASDKLNWVGANLGGKFAQRTIITTDKTLVHANLLIDDKPEIKGVGRRPWTQVLFDQPYNQRLKSWPRITQWENWYEQLFVNEAPPAAVDFGPSREKSLYESLGDEASR